MDLDKEMLHCLQTQAVFFFLYEDIILYAKVSILKATRDVKKQHINTVLQKWIIENTVLGYNFYLFVCMTTNVWFTKLLKAKAASLL